MISNTSKTSNSTQPYLRPSNFSAHKKNTTPLELREKPTTSHVLNHTKNKGTKIFKQNVITGFSSEVLEEKKNSLKWQRNHALIKKFIALLKKICNSLFLKT